MKNFKKILALVLVMVLTAGATLALTLAFLTDETTTYHNVFTSGNVKVSLEEEVGVNDDDEGLTVNPTDANGETIPGAQYDLVAPGDKLTKKVTAKNTGSLDAYMAVTVTVNNADRINLAIDEYYEDRGYTEAQIQAIYDEIFDGWGLNYTKEDANGNATGMRLTITGDDMPEHTLQVDSVKTLDEYALYYAGNWFGEQSDVIPFDGYYTFDMDTYEIKYTYYLYLEPGQETVLFNGLNVPEYFTTEQMAMFDGLEINVSGAAIQADNFADAKTAFAALKAEQEKPVEVGTAASLQEALRKGGSIKLNANIDTQGQTMEVPAGVTVDLDLGGNTITNGVKAAPALSNSGTMTITGGTIVNGNVEAQGAHAIENRGTMVLNNVNAGSDLNRGAAVVNYGDITINGGDFASITRGHPSDGYAYVFINKAGTMTINDATSDYYPNGFFYAVAGSTINVNGGSYKFEYGANTWYIAYAETGATINLNSGTYRWYKLFCDAPTTGNVIVDESCVLINWDGANVEK